MFCARIGDISSTKKVIANFLLKFGKFSLPWQQGSSEQSLTDTIYLADPENPLMRASIWSRTSRTREVIADFVLKIANFHHHGNKGLSEPNLTSIV